MPDDLEPGRPAVEAVFLAFLSTAILGVAAVQTLAALLPPPASEGSSATAVPLTLNVLFVSMAFAVAQAALPGPRSTGGRPGHPAGGSRRPRVSRVAIRPPSCPPSSSVSS